MLWPFFVFWLLNKRSRLVAWLLLLWMPLRFFLALRDAAAAGGGRDAAACGSVVMTWCNSSDRRVLYCC